LVLSVSNGRGKRVVGVAAANIVEDGMTIGIGSGSTAACFIDALISRVRKGLLITAVATSEESARHAASGGITLRDIDAVISLDLAIDGADEIDPQKRMIKGGGGALLREKIIATIADEMVVMVDDSKQVDKLGTFGLPVEIAPFGYTHTLRHLQELGYKTSLRYDGNKEPVHSDNGNYIVDLSFSGLCDEPEMDDLLIRKVPGVIETGFFLGMAGRVLIGHPDGTVDIQG
jgi:ribose 5-phosphate isomerase A